MKKISNNDVIGATAIIKCKTAVPSGYVIYAENTFVVKAANKKYSICFIDSGATIDKSDPTIIHIEWKGPHNAFAPDLITAINNGDTVEILDDLNNIVSIENSFNENNKIDVDKILEFSFTIKQQMKHQIAQTN